jgi:hypothetical protein
MNSPNLSNTGFFPSATQCCSADVQPSKLTDSVKFLLWQFFLYALAAMLVGAGLATVWARSTRAGLKRAFDRAQRAVTSERETNARLRKERASDALLLGEAHELANKLAEVRGAISLVDADLQANQIGRDEAERGRSVAEDQLVVERGFQIRAKRAEAELSSVRNELSDARTGLESLRAELLGRLEESERQRNTAAAAYESLLALHDQLVVQNQSSYTEAILRAEEAESLVVVRDAELERLIHELAASARRNAQSIVRSVSSVPELVPESVHESVPELVPESVHESEGEPLSVVIDLRTGANGVAEPATTQFESAPDADRKDGDQSDLAHEADVSV